MDNGNEFNFKKVREFKQIVINRMRTAPGNKIITFNSASEATKFDNLFNNKCKDEAKILRQGNLNPYSKS